MLCKDVSNFTVPLTSELLAQWQAEGVGLVLIQAFPPSYAQYTEQRAQMRVCAAGGMPFDCYVYDYLGDPTWLSGALDGLDQVFLPSEKPRMVWLDEEDVETEAGWTFDQRINAIRWSLQRVTAASYPAGIYAGGWWWGPKTGRSTSFSEYPLWAAQYDNVADAAVFTPFGGWQECRIKQYAGSQPDGTDLDVLSAAEEAELNGGPPVDDAERAQMQAKIDSLVNSLGYISGDLLAPVAKQKTATKAMQRLIAGIRSQADEQGIAHA